VGRLYDAVKNATTILLVCGIGMGVTVAAISSGQLVLIIISVVLTGIFSGGAFTVAYANARNLTIEGKSSSERKRMPDSAGENSDSERHKEGTGDDNNNLSSASELYYGALKVAWINGISLIGVLWMPIVFSYAAKQIDYQVAWILSAAMVIPFVTVPLAKLPKL
jgi:hypothetical protein